MSQATFNVQVSGSSLLNALVCVQINLIFRFLQSRQKVQIWLFEQTDLRIEGRIIVSPSFTYTTHWQDECHVRPAGVKQLRGESLKCSLSHTGVRAGF